MSDSGWVTRVPLALLLPMLPTPQVVCMIPVALQQGATDRVTQETLVCGPVVLEAEIRVWAAGKGICNRAVGGD